ncbi:hypothetical protein FHL15_007550 [Xylaria flabelliformis]|uniref:Uncharacterized protein n=1 Tax=Xylaria flabelliformis TaxID=2512241 RepID=A0A553HUC0_9PEZI|nr:hypothetical protein FHL15_007550 [Xylaria flabelliformis]
MSLIAAVMQEAVPLPRKYMEVQPYCDFITVITKRIPKPEGPTTLTAPQRKSIQYLLTEHGSELDKALRDAQNRALRDPEFYRQSSPLHQSQHTF